MTKLKKNMKSLIVSLVFISIICSGISSASAATYNVDAGLNNNDIQSIIDKASSGDTIQFLGSEYDNISLVINKTLNLVGAATGTVIKAISNESYIPKVAADNDVAGTAAFYFLNTNGSSASGSSISGFNITSMADSASDISYYNSLIYSLDVSGLKIYNNNLNFSSWGIYVDSSKNGNANDSIFNNTISNMITTGIINFGSANTVIANNTILNCSNHGIDVRHGWGPNAIIYGNLINGADEGIYLMHSSGHNVYNNTILNCTLSSITAYGAANVNITNNTMGNSFVGILLASGFSNVNIQNNTYNLTSTPFPYTFPYYIMVADSSVNGNGSTSNGTFTDSASQVSDISMSSSYSNSSITHGKSTTYTVRVSNKGQGAASNINISNMLPSSSYTSYKVVAVSKGSFNSATGTWNLGNLSSGSDAMIVFTVTAKKAGSISTSPSASYTDHGNKSLNASQSSLTINKNVSTSSSYSISSTKVKKGSYFYITITTKNSGLDTSDLYSAQAKLTNAFLKISTTQTSPFKYSTSGIWTGTIGSSKTIVLKKKIKMAKKGKYTIPIIINGKTVKTYTVTGY